MRRAPHILILLILSPFLNAQDPAPSVNLEKVPSYQRGIAALADHLPEQAVIRLTEAYKVKGLSKSQNQTILIKLAEAQVRANMPDQALETLSNKFLENYPTSTFWKGQALAADGQFSKAIATLTSLTPEDKNYPEAILTAANLSLATGNTNAALTHLATASKLKPAAISQRAKITLAEVHLTRGNLEQARKTLAKTTSPQARQLSQYLKARSLHQENKFAEAIAIYRQLIEASADLPRRISELTQLGLIDARQASGDTSGAINEIVETISNNPEASTLPELLDRLTTWMPADIGESSPNLLRLRDWAGRTPNPNAPISLFPDTGSVLRMPALPPNNSPDTDPLKSLSQFYYAKLLSKTNSAGTLDSALFELAVFRLLYPSHPLVPSSLLLTAKNHLKKKDPSSALVALTGLQHIADDDQITVPLTTEAHAAYLRGMLLLKQKNYPAALAAFTTASESHNREFAKNASINAGLAALKSADLKAFEAQQSKIKDSSLKVALELEKALWMARTAHPQARSALNDFILEHPGHPRATQARIALASICATQPPLNPLMGRALLETIQPSTLSPTLYTEFARTSYELASTNNQWPQAIATAEKWLQKFPDAPETIEFAMRKGIALYRNGEHNKARQVLGQLAVDHPENPLTPLALYYAAMAARLEATPQAKTESIEIFEKVIQSSHPVATEARIQQARILIDLDRIDQAIKSLRTAYKPESKSTQQREIAILLAAALHTQGASDPAKYSQAIDIYDQLLTNKSLPLAWNNRIHFLKGQALQSIGTEESRQAALDTYYQVLNQENRPSDATADAHEWHWFYRCGFKALAMLEKSNRPKAAIAIAKKIASFSKGPRAKEAAERARALEMEHMIWDK